MLSSARAAALGTLLAVTVLLVVPPAAAQTFDGWIIESYDVDLLVEPDGDLLVTETIDLDFRSLQRRGIFRYIPVRSDVDAAATHDLPRGLDHTDVWRRLDLTDITVRSPSGAPTDLLVEQPGRFEGRDVFIRVGDEDVTITGPQTYVISYRVEGALDTYPDHVELYWDATGNDWEVTIQQATVTVRGAAVAEVTCFAGTTGARALCERATVDGAVGRFSHTELFPGTGLTIVAALDPATVDAPPPILEERWDLGRSLTGSPAAIPLAVATGVVGLGGLALLLYRQGRDRVTRGAVTSHGRVDPTAAHERRRGLFESRVVPVEFEPPDGLRPAELGLIIDEKVDAADVSATVVDLAVRGHLTITEEESGRWFWRRTDWRLTERPTPEDDELRDYEARLLRGLFDDDTNVTVSELRGSFHGDYSAVEKLLYASSVRRGWFRRRPDAIRTIWLAVGAAGTVASIGLLVLGVLFTKVAIAAVPLVVTSLLLMALHRHLPHRTAAGSALLVRTLGFRSFIESAESDRMAFAEREQLFVRYLPYAVAFGVVDRWAEVFAELGVDIAAAASGFYVGTHGFDASHFSSGMGEFSSAVGSSLSTVPSSSGSGSGFSGGGFSGGGGGGGGGGSW